MTRNRRALRARVDQIMKRKGSYRVVHRIRTSTNIGSPTGPSSGVYRAINSGTPMDPACEQLIERGLKYKDALRLAKKLCRVAEVMES